MNDEILDIDTSKNKISVLDRYGDNFTAKEYITNPAIGRDEEIRQLIIILLTPEKSAILVGKPGIGKTSIVEGLGYKIRKNEVPDALKGYTIIKLNTASLMGEMPGTSESKIQLLLDEIKEKSKLILFIDEIHTLIGNNAQGNLDFANIFKPGLDRGNIKLIGATTTEEYDRYILRDKAFVRRFQKVEVAEPTRQQTIDILMGTLPKIEKQTGAKMKYTSFIQSKIMAFIVDITSEYKRIYEISARYPDIALTLLTQAFSTAIFENRKEVTVRDVYKAIQNSKNIYPDVIKKELVRFNQEFKDIFKEETDQLLQEDDFI
jgi:ATP-dependent Clp protease ATP-binding subunit ClpA